MNKIEIFKFLLFFIIIFNSVSLNANEKKYIFFGVELNKQLEDNSILTGEYDLGNPIFIPKEKNERFDKYILSFYPLSKKVYSIYAGSNWDAEKFKSQEECVRSRDYYANFIIKKYNMNPEYDEYPTNFQKPVIIFNDDGLKIIISCPGKWMSIQFQDISFFEEYKKEWIDYEIEDLEKNNDLTGM